MTRVLDRLECAVGGAGGRDEARVVAHRLVVVAPHRSLVADRRGQPFNFFKPSLGGPARSFPREFRDNYDRPLAARDLPPSLYLNEKPRFFGDHPWPWVEPTGREKLHVLPAKERFEALSRRPDVEAAARRPSGRGP